MNKAACGVFRTKQNLLLSKLNYDILHLTLNQLMQTYGGSLYVSLTTFCSEIFPFIKFQLPFLNLVLIGFDLRSHINLISCFIIYAYSSQQDNPSCDYY